MHTNANTLEELWVAITNSIANGTSDGKLMSGFIITAVTDGHLYLTQKDANGNVLVEEDTGKALKAAMRYGTDLVDATVDLYLSVCESLDQKTPEFGEMKRIIVSGCKYAFEQLGIDKWSAPIQEEQQLKFMLGVDMDAKQVHNILRAKMGLDFVASLAAEIAAATADAPAEAVTA